MKWLTYIIESVLVGAYWLVGGYALTWILPDPWPFRIALRLMIFGIFLHWINLIFELFDHQAPSATSCIVFALPMTMIFAGVIFWVMAFLGLIEPFR